MAIAVYSFFNKYKSALIFSIVFFQVSLFTGDFAFPVSFLSDAFQKVAKVNPIYHLNRLFTEVWNSTFTFSDNYMSLLYLTVFFIKTPS